MCTHTAHNHISRTKDTPYTHTLTTHSHLVLFYTEGQAESSAAGRIKGSAAKAGFLVMPPSLSQGWRETARETGRRPLGEL